MSKNTFECSDYYRVSDYRGRDEFYNWLVRLHARKGKPWTTEGSFNDSWFWNTFLDVVWPWIPTLIFLYVVYFLATYVYDHKGLFRAIAVLAVMGLIRVNALIRKIDLTNRLLKQNVSLKQDVKK